MNDFPSLINRMKRVIQFRDFSDQDLISIVQAGSIKRYSAGATIFYEEAPTSGLFVLLRGKVHLYKWGPEGQENIIAEINPVIMFNEVAAIDGGPNPISAVSQKNSIIWHTDFESFQYGLETYPELGIGLLPILARRNRQLIEKYANLSFRPVRERVALLLLELSDHGHLIIIRKDNTIQQMAAQIATAPVVISRTLGIFKEEGIIESSRSMIVILQPEKLANLALINFHPEIA
ncbi:MAG: Crp/Fnr family transcriptional regulator [Anaerolineae bacterium]|nr:Crp/Fnr family transcriptional regulator [Anaerolineae bacterium]